MLERIERMVCDICGSSGPEALAGESASELAKAEGWSGGEDGDTCPRCMAKDKTVLRA
jgi:hypothetical protein